MFFDKFINPLVFFLAFAAGLLICYLYQPPPTVVVKFPSPYNAGQIIYRDNSDQCYKYTADKVSCPLDKNIIKPQPIQEDFITLK